ncbi:MAG TPA: alpha/beta hydrolase [Candidatus Dormibacteraeota bacterium]|jgi:pimeloyl-ACP methyl ester carboxylesterase|nr:alpha/beta hydrolase [Candidatus Dormibacteraeota bacterium]
MNSNLETTTSTDGTTIAFERTGGGASVILIGGAFNDRTTVAGLAAMLAPRAAAVTYDRRGRGQSGPSTDYTVEREIEDLQALIGAVGAPVSLFGHSSGAVLALEAAARGLSVRKLALYEPTYIVADSRRRPAPDFGQRLGTLVADGRQGDAAALFLVEAVGLPAEMVEGMQGSEMWPFFVGLASSLPFDAAVCGPGMELPAERLASIRVPTLVLNGGNTPPWLAASSRAVAQIIPGAAHRVVEGQDHGVLQQPDALRDVLVEFLN